MKCKKRSLEKGKTKRVKIKAKYGKREIKGIV
jgi:hypothetical protein